MAKKKTTRKKTKKQVETLTHDEAKRPNIPTAEFQSVMHTDDQSPIRLAYERRNRDLDPQLVWRGKDEQDWSDLVVQAPPLFIQEKVHPKVLIDDLLRRTQKEQRQQEEDAAPLLFQDLYADFNGLPDEARTTEFYQHDANWTNRMILGDSLQVMASLAEREGLRGQVQCIYIDPPYGIKFNSNFQWSTTSRDVKDGKAEHITREPEQVKAFRDTWRDGIHSYLTYLRDRLTAARDLLAPGGSVFVQIGDENIHRIRAIMDEIFGADNHVNTIAFKKKSATFITESVFDEIVWYCKSRENLKLRDLFEERAEPDEETKFNTLVTEPMVLHNVSKASTNEIEELVANGARWARVNYPIVSQHPSDTRSGNYKFRGKEKICGANKQWRFSIDEGLPRIEKAGRIFDGGGESLGGVVFWDDWNRVAISNIWTDIHGEKFPVYVVQTATTAVQRCILLTTDPGDLVLDPTCGSGTTAFVAEQWGRRWITIDTSRVALALARARIMGARYPYYHLADSRDGQLKEAEITRTEPSEAPTYDDIRQGFVYERVPRVKLKAIANNAEIDVIWEQFQTKLEPLREKLNKSLGKKWEEWEIPRDAEEGWSAEAKKLHATWWEQGIARQKEIDASIAAKADFEYLYDKPYEDNRKVRVAGPFTVESLSPHRVLAVDADDELIDPQKTASGPTEDEAGFVQMILDNLKTAGVQQAHKEDKINFTSLAPWPGHFICAEGRYVVDSDEWLVTGGNEQATNHKPQVTEYRAGVFIGPEFGTVSRPDLVAAAREAGDAGFDVLITCAFNYDAHSADFDKLGRIPVLKARMNADLHMAEDLKNTGKGNLFVIFGEPDIEVVSGQWLVASNGRMVAHYDSVKELSGVNGLAEINRLGTADLSGFKELSAGREVRTDQSDSQGGGVGSVQHPGGSGTVGDGGVPAIPERGQRVAGGSRDATDTGESDEHAANGRVRDSHVGSGWIGADAHRAKTIAAIQTLTPGDFPLARTTNHYAQVTIRGVDVFHPTTGEVRSDGAEGIACWFVDTDYNEESFFVRHAYFLGANDPYKSLKTTLKAEVNQDAWATLHSDTSRPFDKPNSGRIAVKVINHLGDEVMKVFRVD